jgi:hypothetical protein
VNRLRTVVAAALVGVLATGGLAVAGGDQPPTAVAPQVTDAPDDSAGGPSTEIVSAGLTTTGTTTFESVTTYRTETRRGTKTVKVKKGKGKKAKTVTKKVPYTFTVQVPVVTKKPHYTPDTLVATITLAGPPSTSAGDYYGFDFSTATCGVSLTYSPGTVLETSGGPGFVNLGACEPATTVTGASYFMQPTIVGNTLSWELPFATVAVAGVDVGATLSGMAVNTSVAEPAFGTAPFTGVWDEASSNVAFTITKT